MLRQLRVSVENPAAHARPARLQATFTTQTSATLAATLPGGQFARLAVSPAGTPFDRVIQLRPGRNRIALATDVPVNPNRKDYIGIVNFRLMDEGARRLAIKASKDLK